MSVLNINKCSFRIVDGRKATLAIGAGNAGITYALKSKHHGTRQDVKVAHVIGGALATLAVVVTHVEDVYTITVTLASTDGIVATSTAAQVKAAVDAAGPAAALVTTSLPGTGGTTAVAAAAAAINTNPARFVEFKVGEGTLTWGENKDIVYVPNKGLLDKVKTGDEQPMSVDTELSFEEYKASTGSGTPTALDALFQSGEAVDWVSTSDGTNCPPYCVDIEVEVNPGCVGVVREFYSFEEFLWDDINPTFKDGKIAFKGQCNRVQPEFYRIT